ncbi:MAG TPA: metal-dependent hydrolase [Candidatus Polarisedimenticolia bacterium]|nr:metal-dependent hydrolase [Candidatus Polarisedimenticolia bacterium]
MFIGHYAVGFASKRAAPQTSLGTLIGAAMLLDLIWPIFLLAGWEQVRVDPGNTAFTPLDFVSYPWSHSLVTACGWAALFALVYWARRRYRAGALLIGLGVISHWVLDALTHRPDMPLYPGGPRLGLGLWNSIAGTMIVEGLMFAAALWLYATAIRPRDRTGRYAFRAFVLAALLMYGINIVNPPPLGMSSRQIGLFSLVAWIIPFWAAWIDRHRTRVMV